MHELSMTTQIIQKILEEAKRHGAKKVTEVHVVIGKITYLGVDQVHFAYKILVEDTIMKDSKLFIEEKDGVIECDSCGYKGAIPLEEDSVYHLIIPTLQCPKCKKTVKIIEGKECTIKSITMVKGEEK